MPHDHRPAITDFSVLGGRDLTAARRQALYDSAPATEPLPANPAPATLTGQLRVLELQRATIEREIAQLRAQLLQEGTPLSAARL